MSPDLKSRLERSKPLTARSFAERIAPSATGDVRFVVISGPVTLHRFGRINFGEPQDWFEDDEFHAARAKAQMAAAAGGSYGDELRRILRNRLAIRLDWNDLTVLSSLHVPDDVRLEAFESIVRPQGQVDPDRMSPQRLSTPIFIGGARQITLFARPEWTDRHPEFLKGN